MHAPAPSMDLNHFIGHIRVTKAGKLADNQDELQTR